MTVTPGDGSCDRIGNGVFHCVDIDVVVATAVHLGEGNLVGHVFVGGKVTEIFRDSGVIVEEFVYFLGGLLATGHSANDEAGAIG